MSVRPERKLTYEDYLQFPDGERWEVIDGEAFVVASPNTRHQRILLRLVTQIYAYLEIHGGGEVFIAPFDVVLSRFDVLQPDIVFISSDDVDVLTEANVRGSQTWVVEVLSLTHPERDRKLKLARCEAFGVREYWIVDPMANTVDVYRLASGEYVPAETASAPGSAAPLTLPELTIDLTALFED